MKKLTSRLTSVKLDGKMLLAAILKPEAHMRLHVHNPRSPVEQMQQRVWQIELFMKNKNVFKRVQQTGGRISNETNKWVR